VGRCEGGGGSDRGEAVVSYEGRVSVEEVNQGVDHREPRAWHCDLAIGGNSRDGPQNSASQGIGFLQVVDGHRSPVVNKSASQVVDPLDARNLFRECLRSEPVREHGRSVGHGLDVLAVFAKEVIEPYHEVQERFAHPTLRVVGAGVLHQFGVVSAATSIGRS
jgi:hypothetical protein